MLALAICMSSLSPAGTEAPQLHDDVDASESAPNPDVELPVDAPESYDFEIGGDVTSLELDSTGGVTALDGAGEQVAYAPAPWAVDAEGVTVPTHYEVDGTTLTQVVEHRGGHFTHSITADPNWVKAAKCIAAITYVAFTSAFIVGKATKIVNAIKVAKTFVKEVGGIRAAAKLLAGASTKAERAALIEKGRSIAGASFLDFVGITQIKDGCF